MLGLSARISELQSLLFHDRRADVEADADRDAVCDPSDCPYAGESVGLDQIGCGVFCCSEVRGNDDSAKRLKRLGLCQGHAVEVLHDGDPMFIAVAGSQIGLSRSLAKMVRVCHAASTHTSTTLPESSSPELAAALSDSLGSATELVGSGAE